MEKARQLTNIKPIDNSSSGHRVRARNRFLQSKFRGLMDYEVLELILFYSLPRVDTKLIAKQLLNKFGSLIEVLHADNAELLKIDGIGESVVFQFKLLQDFFTRLSLPVDKPIHVINSWKAVLDYCNFTMGFKRIETFRVLYLNKKNILLADDINDGGTIDKVQVYPREVAKRVLETGSSAIIMVHNHPSGDPNPSPEDIEMTKLIIKAIEPIGARVHDHLIVSKDKHFSFRNNFLI
jgi:DNA repair protein RadC